MIGPYLDDVEAIIAYSQDYPFDIDARALLKKWEQAKQPFIQAFGGQTIVRSEKPIRIVLSEEQRNRRFEDFIRTLDASAILTEDLERFLKDNKDGFFNNQVLHPCPEKNIKPGSKLSRSFRRFIDDGTEVRWAQDIASYYIQENKIEGYLYLSVDPRDFLTLSENNARWCSCQSLDGEYRAGDLSYMTDTTTVVAYLASERKEHLRCLPKDMVWNSKKWRMLAHINSNCIYYNCQYPYFSNELLEAVYKMILDHIGHYDKPMGAGFKIVQNHYGERQFLESNYLTAGGVVFDSRDIIDTSDYLGYCDLITSSSYAPIVSVKEERLDKFQPEFYDESKDKAIAGFKKVFGIKIGEKTPCVCCGQDTIKRDCSFLCPECIAYYDADEDFFLTCNDCGHRIYDDDEIFWEGDQPYCKSCHNSRKKEDIIKEED